MEVNWLNTMHLALGSATSMRWIASFSASSFVLLWNALVLMRLRMLRFLNMLGARTPPLAPATLPLPLSGEPPAAAALLGPARSIVSGRWHVGQSVAPTELSRYSVTHTRQKLWPQAAPIPSSSGSWQMPHTPSSGCGASSFVASAAHGSLSSQ